MPACDRIVLRPRSCGRTVAIHQAVVTDDADMSGNVAFGRANNNCARRRIIRVNGDPRSVAQLVVHFGGRKGVKVKAGLGFNDLIYGPGASTVPVVGLRANVGIELSNVGYSGIGETLAAGGTGPVDCLRRRGLSTPSPGRAAAAAAAAVVAPARQSKEDAKEENTPYAPDRSCPLRAHPFFPSFSLWVGLTALGVSLRD